ncbi:MAG: pyridoxal 5'-phosphate synthase glutaminase subunit PdxT [Bacillota bacterium]|nr:pyridoxal 5'-phosphate synthase glutaminase subunit PdxT [Bacillota bacterium]
MKVGVLAMQGAFREHARALERCGCTVLEVRMPRDVEEIEALVLPGGESTTIGKLVFDFGLAEPILGRAQAGLPVFGTCAGAVLLARDIVGSDQKRLGLMDIRIHRNAYGRQVDSFETDLEIPFLGAEPFPAVFIRAPLIEAAGPEVEVLARYREGIVLARQGRVLAATFHPELTPDLRIHRYFLELAAGPH